MIKAGQLLLNNQAYNLYEVSDGINFRLDVVETDQEYDLADSTTALASCCSYRGRFYTLGNAGMALQANSIMHDAKALFAPEEQKLEVIDGKIYQSTSKSNRDDSISYSLTQVNGKPEKEVFITEAGTITIEYFDFTLTEVRPINSTMYTESAVVSSDVISAFKPDGEYYSEEQLRILYPWLKHIDENDYVIVESEEQAEQRLQEWIDSPSKIKAFDIESTGTDWSPTSPTRITGVFLGYSETNSTYFPVRQDNFEFNLDPDKWLHKIADALDCQPEDTLLGGHNLQFELLGFYKEVGRMVRYDFDTYLLSLLLNPVFTRGTHTLKALATKYTGKQFLTLEQIFVGPVKFNILPPGIVKLYGCPDASSPIAIFKKMIKELPEDSMQLYKLECKLIKVKAMQVFYGLPLDVEYLQKAAKEQEELTALLESKFREMTDCSLNINSAPVMRDILYNQMQIVPKDFTPKGDPAINKSAIKNILDANKVNPEENDVSYEPIVFKDQTILSSTDLASNKYPALLVYQRYKLELKKNQQFTRLIAHTDDGFFRFYINQFGAATGRQTSDAHQFDDSMKKCVVAMTKHHGLVSCDYCQIELRILAGAAGETDLIKTQSDPDVDVHRANASVILGRPMCDISEEERSMYKSINFGNVYLMSPASMARKEYGIFCTKENIREMEDAQHNYFLKLPRVNNFIENNKRQIREKGMISTAFGYHRPLPQALDPSIDKSKLNSIIRSGNNTPIQGFGATILKIAELNYYEYIHKKGWDKCKDYDGKMLPQVIVHLPIHDEVLISYDTSIPKEEIIKMCNECQEFRVKDFPPFFANPAFVPNWYAGKDSATEIPWRLKQRILQNWEKGIPTFSMEQDDYLQVLTDYRKTVIADYMQDLIKKYPDFNEMVKHITHDTLTHTLIESMLTNKSERRKLTHKQRIAEAARRYMEGMNLSIHSEKEEELSYDEPQQQNFHADAEGNIIVEDNDDEYFDDNEEAEEKPLTIEEQDAKFVKSFASKILFTMTECFIDISTIPATISTHKVLEAIKSLNDDNGFYSVSVIIGDSIIPTGVKLNYDVDSIMSTFKERGFINE